MTAELRRGVFLAVLGLLIGLGLVAALFGGFGGFDPLRPARSPEPAPGAAGAVGALSPGPSAGAVPPRPADASRPADPPTPAAGGGAQADALRFDVVRVEPSGESVVAGRGAPNKVVELLVDGKPVAKALADPNGQFAIVPPALPAGNSEIALRSTGADGRETRSADSVAVAVSPSRTAKPLVALTSPDKPTVVLSQPDAPAPIARQAPDGTPGRPAQGKDATGKDATGKDVAAKDAAAKDAPGKAATAKETAPAKAPAKETAPAKAAPAPVTIVSVDAQEGGRLFVTGQASPGATVRLYLNDTMIAPASVGADGKVTFTIGKGVKPGAYTVRVDQVDSVTGKVRGRAEVPFSVPEPARIAANPPPAKPSAALEKPGAAPDKSGAVPDKPGAAPEKPVAGAGANPAAPAPQLPAALDPPRAGAGVFVAEVATAKIIRGDSLWQISRRTYGAGDRYTVIYDANQEQIRNPDLIYPGQIFVLPGKGDKRG